MRHRIPLHAFVLVSSLMSFVAGAAECDDPKSSEQVAQCLGIDLRDADARINASYKALFSKLNEKERTDLRQAQRTWIRNRDSACRLDTRESDREKWYQALLQDYAKTVCVTRFTRRRTKELDSMLAGMPAPHDSSSTAAAPSAPASPQSSASAAIAPERRQPTVHSNGKWYFELTIDYAEAVKIEPCVVTVGVTDREHLTGILENIRTRDAGKDIRRYGFAVDLDNGKLYVSTNGAWLRGEPGSNRGQDLKLGRNYYGTVMTSADSIAPYVERKAVVPNFGDSGMTYSLPAGYSPWRNRTVN